MSRKPQCRQINKARFRHRSTHVPNLTDELIATKEPRLNQFGTAVLLWCGESVKFDRVCGTLVELNLGSRHGVPSESYVAPQCPPKVELIQFGSAHEKYGV